MPNPTSGFQLSALPQPLSFPTNIGMVDVGQMQKAYANAMQNVQDTALFGQRVAANRAALDLQEQQARQQQSLLADKTRAERATYGATAATQGLSEETALGQIPNARAVAQAEQGTKIQKLTEELIRNGVSLKNAQAIAEAQARRDKASAEADALLAQERLTTGGGPVIRSIPVGKTGVSIPVAVGAGGGVTQLGGTLAKDLATKQIVREKVEHSNPYTDENGNQVVDVTTYNIDELGKAYPQKTQSKVPFSQARKEGYYDLSVKQDTAEPSEQKPATPSALGSIKTVSPEILQQAGIFGQSGPLTSFGTVPQAPTRALAVTTPAQAPQEAVAPQQVAAAEPAAATEVPAYLARRGGEYASPFSALGQYAPDAMSVPAASASGTPAMLARPAPAEPERPAALQPETAPIDVPPPAPKPVEPKPEIPKVPVPWLNNKQVQNNEPAAKTQAEFDKAFKVTGTASDSLKKLQGKFQEEIQKEGATIESRRMALFELVKAAKEMQSKGIGSGLLQSKVPPGFLQFFGDSTAQSFEAAANELVNDLSNNTRFRNFGVVDLIKSTKPQRSDDNLEIIRKLNYIGSVLDKQQESIQAQNEGLRLNMLPKDIRNIVTRNYSAGNMESYDQWSKNHRVYIDPSEKKKDFEGAIEFVTNPANANDPRTERMKAILRREGVTF